MPNAWAAGRGGQWLRTSAELEQAFRSTPYDHRAHTLDVVEAEDADLSESMRREGYDMSASDSRPAYRAPSPSAARLDTRLLPRHPELAIAMSSRRGPSCAHPSQSPSEAGSVVGLWRYPVKSMMGEELSAAEITDHGVVGDRRFAVVDATTGKVAGAKNPRKWGNFFDYRAAYVEPPRAGSRLPAVRLTLPDGTVVTNEHSELAKVLSESLGREVRFAEASHGEALRRRRSTGPTWTVWSSGTR